MKTKTSNFIASLCLVILSTSALYGRPDTLNEYDENSANTNTYDLDQNNFGTYGHTTADFVYTIDQEWYNGKAGVIDFDGDYIISGNTYSTGIGQGGYINGGPLGHWTDIKMYNSGNTQSFSVLNMPGSGISNDNIFFFNNDKDDFRFDFPPTSAGANITAIGFTVLDELIDSNYDFDIIFVDETSNSTSFTFDSTIGKDQFFGYEADTANGHYLDYILFKTGGVGGDLFMDDMALTITTITPVPETSTSLLGVVGVFGMALRRRRA